MTITGSDGPYDSTGLDEIELANIQLAVRWGEYYNTDVERMVSECYAEDCLVDVVGAMRYRGHDAFHFLEQAIASVAPRRRAHAEHMIARGNQVIVQAYLADPDRGPTWKTRFCVVLTIENGKIVLDQTYADLTQWPAPKLTPRDFKRHGIARTRPMMSMLVAVLPQMIARATINMLRCVAFRGKE